MRTLRPVMILSVFLVTLLAAATPATATPATATPAAAEPAAAVTFTSGPPPSGVAAHQPYPGHTFTATGAETIKFSLVPGDTLPPGLVLSAATGTLTGTPTVASRFTFTVRATDSPGGNVADQQVTVLVVQPLITVTSGAPTSPWYVGQTYPAHRFTAEGGNAPYRLTLRSGALPAGMALSSAGALVGTPTVGGSHQFGIRMTDANGFHGDQEVSIVVAAPAVVITSAPPPTGTAGLAYSFRLTAEGDSDIRFSVAAGDLPDGLTLAVDGWLSGTPRAAGSFAFTVRAAGTATSGTGEVTLTVAAAPSVASPTSPAPTDPPTRSTPTPATSTQPTTSAPAPAAPKPTRTTGSWLPMTGSNSVLVLALLAVVAFSIAGILFVMAHERRRRFTTPR
ncbi:Ig domain-containing protein [Micromonospora sp. LOL_024]|uniref:Ig domain-containing protein n=1 Tax=Micromonospora sp. LOL_024 TaxID=3345412 RepID=UPI003A852415